MKSLFLEDNSWSPEALKLAELFDQALEPIIRKAAEDGYSPREAAYIAMSCVSIAENITRMDIRLGRSKKKGDPWRTSF